MGKTFKDVRKDYKIVDHRYKKKDKRRKRLDEVERSEDEVTKIDETGRDGYLDNTNSPTRDTRGLGSQDEYDTPKETNESSDQGDYSVTRDSPRDIRDIGSVGQDEGGLGGGDN